ncbi:MAG: CPBP family intramembrane glutamic endopeptidase [Actinomycetota bacterium]
MSGRSPVPANELPPRVLREEVVVVLSLSILASAVYAFLSLLEAPIRGETVVSVSQTASFLRHLANFVFGLAPVALVLHLVRRSGEGPAALGLRSVRPRRDVAAGVGLAAVLGAGGAGLYLLAVELGVNRFVVPAPPAGYWWTVPVLLMTAVRAALLEEIVAVGYLVTRLRQAGRAEVVAVGASALLRAAYHLYQGWGGFLGNLVLGAVFGAFFVRTRRTWPLVVAHALIDVGAGAIYLAFADRLPGFGG